MYHYEIHVTVGGKTTAEQFKLACKLVNVKPVFLHLQAIAGGQIVDVMTSSVYTTDDVTGVEAIIESIRIKDELEGLGFVVVRTKIETSINHPKVLAIKSGDDVPNGCYFESHLNVRVQSERDMDNLEVVSKQHNSHLSRNVYKELSPTCYTLMTTLRDYKQLLSCSTLGETV